MLTIIFGTILPWLLIVVGTWLGYQLVRQNGRMLLRLESIETLLGTPAGNVRQPEPSGLPLGTIAPDFELPDLAGTPHRLSGFRGKNLLLMFFNPQCGFCTQMAADLAALPPAGDGALPIVVTTGDADENRQFVEQFGIRCVVLLQQEMEIATQFRVAGTPMGYLIDGSGRIASELAVGADPLLQLAAGSLPHESKPGDSKNGTGRQGKTADPSLARSRLKRDGLKTGDRAPEFRLPRIDGGELSLADFQGRQVLLVFSDPDCGPCDELAPRLQQIHVQRTDLDVLVVSRRDAEANLAKADKLGLSFPIVLQKQWEISLQYAMFATPIGYLIDRRGILVSDVAVGVEPILALADRPIEEFYRDEQSLPEQEQAWAT